MFVDEDWHCPTLFPEGRVRKNFSFDPRERDDLHRHLVESCSDRSFPHWNARGRNSSNTESKKKKKNLSSSNRLISSSVEQGNTWRCTSTVSRRRWRNVRRTEMFSHSLERTSRVADRHHQLHPTTMTRRWLDSSWLFFFDWRCIRRCH